MLYGQGMDVVLGRTRSPDADYSPSTIDLLEKQVESMYIKMERSDWRSLPSSGSCTTQNLRHHLHGQVVQVVTTTPMSCSVEESTRIVWHNVTAHHDNPDKVYRHVRSYSTRDRCISLPPSH